MFTASSSDPLVSFYDVDTGSFDVAADGDAVTIYGHAFFRPTALRVDCPVPFSLVLQRADAGRDPKAFIRLDASDLRAAGVAYGKEKAAAALLRALMTPGLLYRELIDKYLPAREITAGSLSFLVTASGWVLDGRPSATRPGFSDMFAYARLELSDMQACERISGSEKAKAVACDTWADVVEQLRGHIPAEVLAAFDALAQEQLK